MNKRRINFPLSQIDICMPVMSEIFDATSERVRFFCYE